MIVEQINSDGSTMEIDGRILVRSETTKDLRLWLEYLSGEAHKHSVQNGKGVLVTNNKKAVYVTTLNLPMVIRADHHEMMGAVQEKARKVAPTQFILGLTDGGTLLFYRISMEEWLGEIAARLKREPAQ